MKNYQPQPWFEPEVKHKPKYREYFHERLDILNSLAHSSPKIASFYLKPNSEKLSKQISEKSQATENSLNQSTENTMRKIHSRERLHRRKQERELLQAKSNQCLPTFQINTGQNHLFSTFKDPATNPINPKLSRFNNFSELPEERLKLVINDRILKMDEKALENIDKKLQKEAEMEQMKKEWHEKNRKKILGRLKKQQHLNQAAEKRNGLKKVKIEKKYNEKPTSARINSLSTAKSMKVGYAEDYLDSYGLIKAGVLNTGRSAYPKSARRPLSKKTESFPVFEEIYPAVSMPNEKFETGKKEFDKEVLITNKEIEESMHDLNAFHKRFGELKGRVGFPHIDLESYKVSMITDD